jgi:hypothetical protein
MSLKTQIETTIAAAIQEIAGADYSLGPLVRVVIESHATEGEEFGTPSERVSTLRFGLNVAGITALHDDPSQAGQAASDVEEIIRLHLQHLAFDIETSYGDGRHSYATELQYLGSNFDVGTISGRQTAPVIEAPQPQAGNSGGLTLTVDPDEAYSGPVSSLLSVKVVTPNSAPGSVAGLTLAYKIDSGPWSNPLPVGSGFVPLAYNIFARAATSGSAPAQPDDTWTIQAKTSQLFSIGMWVQSWVMIAEAIAVY